MAEQFGNFMATYGFYGVIIIIAVMICTQLTKWPIKKWAMSYAVENKLEDNGKKIITRWLMIVPFIYSFVFTLIYVLGSTCAWDVNAINWFTVAQYTIAYATIAMALFETVKAFVTGNKEKTFSLNSGVSEEAKQAKLAEKEAKKKAKEEAKAEKAKAKAQQKVLALQKELAELNSQAVKEVVGTNVVNS